MSPNTKDIYYPLFTESIKQLEPASSDIAICIPPFHASIIGFAEATIPYLYIRVTWHIPCPNPASRWTSMFQIFRSVVWACFGDVAILAVIIMWLLTKYETQIHVRESAKYRTIMNCIYNECAVLTALSVPQKPISHSLRIFFIAWVLYPIAITTVYQAYFLGSSV